MVVMRGGLHQERPTMIYGARHLPARFPLSFCCSLGLSVVCIRGGWVLDRAAALTRSSILAAPRP
jgi:hypothetical protein